MNPFVISAYKAPELFCDREKETRTIINSVTNGVNIVLYSLRRMGKTGLIKNVFHELSAKTGYELIYIDIYRTKNVDDFVNELANAMLRIDKKVWYKRVLEFLKKFRPVLTINPLTGQMEAEIRAISGGQGPQNLDAIFQFIEHYPAKIILAIDEFQQITEYPEPGFEAFLRSKIQFLNNVNFIYSGSNRRIISSMFQDYNRPFYQSGSTLYLDKIPEDAYAAFVYKLMEKTNRKITEELIIKGLQWTETYTWFTQNYFNRLWGTGVKTITESLMKEVKQEIFAEKERDFIEWRNLLPENQMKLLTAIAKENSVQKPTSKDFLIAYKLGSTSTVNSALRVLQQKEIIYYEQNAWQLYDVYMKRFLQGT
jgi:uncharacterized protein